MDISKIVVLALAILAAPAAASILAEEIDADDSTVLPPPPPCKRADELGIPCEIREENMGSWTARYGVIVFDDCSECFEDYYFNGTCQPSMCSNWTLKEGCKPAVEFEGLISKVALINNSAGKTAEDVIGWDVTYRAEDAKCYRYYVAQPPRIGMTKPMEVTCLLGVRTFDRYMVDFEEAIAIMQSMDCGDTFVELSLFWPLTPAVEEPEWHIKTDIGNEIVIGANCGQSYCATA